MEMINSNNFIEISENDMRAIDGGVWPQAVAIVTLLGATLVGAFSAGRVFVRDVRNKFFS